MGYFIGQSPVTTQNWPAFFFQKLQCTMSLIHFYISLINTPPSLVTGMTEKKPEDQSIFSVCFYMYMYIKCLSFYT